MEIKSYSELKYDYLKDNFHNSETAEILAKQYAYQFLELAYKLVKDYNPERAPLTPIFNKSTILEIQDLINK